MKSTPQSSQISHGLKTSYQTIGWREWLALPQLGVRAIKAKIDTGARSSVIHASHLKLFSRQGKSWVRFQVYPAQRNLNYNVATEAEILDLRQVRNSGGQAELRIVISTMAAIAGYEWPIELTLTNRDVMGFRMLLGRAAVRGRFLVDPGRSYLLSSRPDFADPDLEDEEESQDFLGMNGLS